jgi:hypothetical protein
MLYLHIYTCIQQELSEATSDKQRIQQDGKGDIVECCRGGKPSQLLPSASNYTVQPLKNLPPHGSTEEEQEVIRKLFYICATALPLLDVRKPCEEAVAAFGNLWGSIGR